MEDRRSNGCLKGKFDIRDYKFKRKVAMAVSYPDEFSCLNMPPIKNQGSVGSCVAHATSEILEFHDDCKHKLSTNFIYGIHNKLYGSEGPGMYLREACKIVKDYGDPEYELCPKNTEVKSVYEEALKAFNNQEIMNNANKYRVSGYTKLLTENDIKYALMNYGPVLGAVTWYSENKVVNGILNKGVSKSGGHAIVIYGWNKDGLLCQNSWGSSWGNKGNFVLPYTYKVDEAYSIIPYAEDRKDDILVPKRSDILDVIYKIINLVINAFRK